MYVINQLEYKTRSEISRQNIKNKHHMPCFSTRSTPFMYKKTVKSGITTKWNALNAKRYRIY